MRVLLILLPGLLLLLLRLIRDVPDLLSDLKVLNPHGLDLLLNPPLLNLMLSHQVHMILYHLLIEHLLLLQLVEQALKLLDLLKVLGPLLLLENSLVISQLG